MQETKGQGRPSLPTDSSDLPEGGQRSQSPVQEAGHGHAEERREVGFAWAVACYGTKGTLDMESGGDGGKQLADTGANFLQMEPILLTQTDFFMKEGGPLSAHPS